MKCSSSIALALAAAVMAAPFCVQAQESSARRSTEGKSSEPAKPSKKHKRSFKRDEPAAAEDRASPPVTENALTVTPNVPGTGEDDPIMRGGGERPNTN